MWKSHSYDGNNVLPTTGIRTGSVWLSLFINLLLQSTSSLKLHNRTRCNFYRLPSCRGAAGSGFSFRSLKRSEADELDGVQLHFVEDGMNGVICFL